jgi:hypothetical protein
VLLRADGLDHGKLIAQALRDAQRLTSGGQRRAALALKDGGLCRAAAMAKEVPTPVIEAFLARDWKQVGAGLVEL